MGEVITGKRRWKNRDQIIVGEKDGKLKEKKTWGEVRQKAETKEETQMQ